MSRRCRGQLCGSGCKDTHLPVLGEMAEADQGAPCCWIQAQKVLEPRSMAQCALASVMGAEDLLGHLLFGCSGLAQGFQELEGRYARGARKELELQWATESPLGCPHFFPCSIHNGVIAVFQRKGLPDRELFLLNEGVR